MMVWDGSQSVKFLVLAIWATGLLIVRSVWLHGDHASATRLGEGGSSGANGADSDDWIDRSVVEVSARTHDYVKQLKSLLGELEQLGATGGGGDSFSAADAFKALEGLARDMDAVVTDRSKEGGDVLSDAAVAHHSDAFLQPTVSRVPNFPSNAVFCDQLLNTYPMFFGGDVPLSVVQQWCKDASSETDGYVSLLQNFEFADHLPPGVEDRYFIPFTLLQVLRKLYMLEIYVDRTVRFRETLAPMIDTMESRRDAMLYNYI